MFLLVFFSAYAWAKGIDDMATNHPDYSGEDLFDEEPVKKDPIRIPLTLIRKNPNDAELGKKVREIYNNRNK